MYRYARNNITVRQMNWVNTLHIIIPWRLIVCYCLHFIFISTLNVCWYVDKRYVFEDEHRNKCKRIYYLSIVYFTMRLNCKCKFLRWVPRYAAYFHSLCIRYYFLAINLYAAIISPTIPIWLANFFVRFPSRVPNQW